MKPLGNPIKILFVCMGNICRSPSADIVFHRMVADAGLDRDIKIDSAGTIGYHAGNPPDSRMAAALRERGYDITGSARKVSTADFDDFDFILPMDEDNENDLRRLLGRRKRRAEIRPFVSFCTENVVRHVPDPYYGGPEGFERVADIIEDGCRGLLDYLRKELNG